MQPLFLVCVPDGLSAAVVALPPLSSSSCAELAAALSADVAEPSVGRAPSRRETRVDDTSPDDDGKALGAMMALMLESRSGERDVGLLLDSISLMADVWDGERVTPLGASTLIMLDS